MDKVSEKRDLRAPLFGTALTALAVFAGCHVLLCYLQISFLPMADGKNVLWLGIELALGIAAGLTALICLWLAMRKGGEDARRFREVLAELRSPGFLLLAVWVLWAVIACLLAIREGRTSFYHNVRYLFYQAADMIVLFALGLYFGGRAQKRYLLLLFDACLLVFVLIHLYALVRFFLGESHFTAFFQEHVFKINRPRAQYGLNKNCTAAYAGFFLVFGLYRFSQCGKAWQRVLLCAGECVVMLVFASVESRSALAAVVLAVFVWGGCAGYQNTGSFSFSRALLRAVGAAAAFLVVFYGMLLGFRAVQRAVLAAEASAGLAAAFGSSPGQEAAITIRTFTGDLGGRVDIWRTVLREIVHDRHLLLHGCSLASTSYQVEEWLGVARRTHNQLLEILLAQGLPSTLLFLGWLVWIVKKSLRVGLRRSGDGSWTLPLSLLMMIVNNMAEMMLVGMVHITGCFFFLIAGYAAGMADADKRAAL